MLITPIVAKDHPNYQINLHLRLDEKIALNPVRKAFKKCFYLNDKFSEEAVSVKIKYSIKGKKIKCRVLFFENSTKTKELLLKGKADNWKAIDEQIISSIMKEKRP